uniref:Uncharacterized protein n=1 Tax=Anopheles darlingi TaxID=43151 RepID=A0A2M4DIB2_ANODA
MALVVLVVVVVGLAVLGVLLEVSLVPLLEAVNRTTPCGPADTRRICPAGRSIWASVRSVPVASCLMVVSSGLPVVVLTVPVVAVVVVVRPWWLGVVGVMREGEAPPEVSLALKLRWDSGDEGGVKVGSRSGAAFVVRATNRSSIPPPVPLPPFWWPL